MTGEGSPEGGGEGEGRDERDGLEDYARELDEKYSESRESEEETEATGPAKEGETNAQAELEAYARQLEEKYGEEDGGEKAPNEGEDASGGKEDATDDQSAKEEQQDGGEQEAKCEQAEEAQPPAEGQDTAGEAGKQSEADDSEPSAEEPDKTQATGDEDKAGDQPSPEGESQAEPEAGSREAPAEQPESGDSADGKQSPGGENELGELAPPEAELATGPEVGANQPQLNQEQLESEKDPLEEKQEAGTDPPELTKDPVDASGQAKVPIETQEAAGGATPDQSEQTEVPSQVEGPVGGPPPGQPESPTSEAASEANPTPTTESAQAPEADLPKTVEPVVTDGGRPEPPDVALKENPDPLVNASGDRTVVEFATPDERPPVGAQAERVAAAEGELKEQPLAVIEAKAYEYQIPGRDPNVRFDIRSESLQRAAGVEMKDGSSYEIRGRIGDVCEFSKTHVEKEGNHVIIMVPKEHREEVQHGQRYEIRIDSIEERRTFRAEKNGERADLNFQPTVLESLGFRPRDVRGEGQAILEFQLNSLSKPGDGPITAFTQTMPHDGGARLSVTRLGAKGGDEFEVLGLRERTLPSFVKEFNAAQRPEELRNVQLDLAKDRLSLDVDGHRFPFTDHNLSTRNLELVLRTHLELSKREVRFWYDGQNYKPRLDDCKILGFKASEHGLKIVYEASQHRVSTVSSELYVDQIPKIAAERPNLGEYSSSLKMLNKPEGPLGDYAFEADMRLHKYVHSRLEGLRGAAYIKAKGDVGEDICPAVLSLNDWQEITRYPLDFMRGRGSSIGRGPDNLMLYRPTREQVLFEFKWRKDIEQAFSDASEEIGRPKVRRAADGSITGGYIGILDWELGSRRGVLHVREAWRRS